jgi:hypothetical protein
MAEKYTPVAFNEGAPLDPTDLTKLQNNLSNLFAQVGGLKTSTTSGSYTVVVDYGQTAITTVANKAVMGDKLVTAANLENYASATNPVQFVVSLGGTKLNDGEWISLAVQTTNGGQNPTLWASSNKARTVKVNWVATVKKYN